MDEATYNIPYGMLILAMILSVLVGYPIGYLLIDRLQWIVVPDSYNGYVQVARYLVGAFSVAVLVGPIALWDMYRD